MHRPATAPLAVVLAVVVVLAGSPLVRSAEAVVPGSAPSPRSAVADLEDRFLTTRPVVGPTWVVDLAGTGTAERLLARTLQGIVNRTEARLYLVDPGDRGARPWIEEYERRGLVDVIGTTDLAGALDRFAGDASGYVVGSESEPWTIAVAATIAAVEGGVVATPELVPALQARGLGEIDDVRGRWPDAPTAYEALVADRYAGMSSRSMAVVRPSDSLFDFTVQQGILTLFTRPDDPSWPRVSALLGQIPDGVAVYGYLSDTGEEEAVAVATLSAAGNFLVPTDTTRNLSFHVAVGAGEPRAVLPEPDTSGVAPCTSDTVNVVVGVTDGDNVNVPLNHFRSDANWLDPDRGSLPLSWSMGPQLAILAPAAWDTYVEEATPSDELAGIIGYGYAAPVVLPDPADFYTESFALMSELGMRTFWSLGGGLEVPSAAGWPVLDAAADAQGTPDAVLVGYGNGTGRGATFHSPGGRLAVTSGTAYGDTPAEIADQIRALRALDPADRPPVVFISATNWSNPVGALVDALAPLRDEGVRFLTGAEAAACLPPPPEEPPPTIGPGTCLPDEPITATGLALVSDVARGEITSRVTPVDLPATVSATPTVAAGGTIDVEAEVVVDAPSLAAEILEERVVPIVAGGFGEELADSAWLELAFDDLRVGFVHDGGAAPLGSPTVESTGPPASARWQGSEVQVVVDPFTASTASTAAPGAPFRLTVRWTVVAGARPDPFSTVVVAAPTSFELGLTVGVLLGTTPIVGGATAPWRCGAVEGVLASTRVVAAAPGSTTTTAPPTTAPPTTTPPTTDTAAPTTTSAPGTSAAPSARAGAAPVATAAPRLTG